MSRSLPTGQHDPSDVLPRRARVVLASVGLATGAALVAHIVTKVSLALAVVLAVVAIGGGVALLARRLEPDRRADLVRRVRVGALAGVVATAAYDAARYGLVAVAQLSFKPFHAFELFGQGLLGEGATPPATYVAGTLFHVANGVGFAVAFALFVRRPSILKGIAWAMVLEISMIALYPSWMQLQAIGELAEVSVLGHAVYGTVLGVLTRRWLAAPTSVGPAEVVA